MKKLICLLFPVLLLLSSCASQRTESQFNLYFYKDANKDAIAASPIDAPDGPLDENVRLLFSQLSTAPKENFVPVLPPEIALTQVSFKGKNCVLNLSDEYLKLDEISRTALNACLTKTICQLPYPDSITIECGDFSETFYPDNFIVDSPKTVYDTHTVNLYFADEEFDALASESRIFSLEASESLELAVTRLLLSGPTKIGMQHTIPQGTVINSVYVKDGVCYIDFSSEFVDNAVHDAVHEEVIVYSVVNTITELPMINSVKILIDGGTGYGYSFCKIAKPLTYKSELLNV